MKQRSVKFCFPLTQSPCIHHDTRHVHAKLLFIIEDPMNTKYKYLNLHHQKNNDQSAKDKRIILELYCWLWSVYQYITRHDNIMPWEHSQYMMTSSNGSIFRVTGPLCGEFTGHRWIPLTKAVTWNFDVFVDLRLNKRFVNNREDSDLRRHRVY